MTKQSKLVWKIRMMFVTPEARREHFNETIYGFNDDVEYYQSSINYGQALTRYINRIKRRMMK